MVGRSWKILAAVALLGLLAGLGVYGTRVREQRITRALRAEAAEAERAMKYDQAERALARYLTILPADQEAFAAHAALLERLAKTPADWLKVVADYERVVSSDPGRGPLRRRLAEIAVTLGRYREAENHLRVLCASTPNDGALEFLLGRCREGQADFPAAVGLYEKARTHAPGRLEASVRLSSLLRDKLADPQRADRVIDEMVASNPELSEAWLARARYRELLHQSGAEKDLERSAALAPDDVEVMLDQAKALLKAGDFVGARGVLARVQKKAIDDPRSYGMQAEVEIRSGRPAEALAALRSGIAKRPEQVELRWTLAHLLAQDGVTDELALHIGYLREARYPQGLVDYLAAWLCFNRGDWVGTRTALERLGPTLDDRPDLLARVNYLRSRCFGRAGDADRQIAALRSALQHQPSWLFGRMALASALATGGKTDEAIEVYRAVVPLAPEGRLALAQLLLTRNAGLPAARRDWEELERLLGEMSGTAPDTTEVAVLRAAVREAQGRPAEAREILKGARGRKPDQLVFWLSLAGLADRQGKPDEAETILDEAVRRLGDRAAIRLERITLRANHEQSRTISAIENLGEGLERFTAVEQLALLRALAKAYAKRGDGVRCRECWSKVAGLDPNDVVSRVTLFDLARASGDEAAMKARRDELKRIEGAGDLTDLIEARYLSWRAGLGDRSALDAARALVTSLLARRPDWPSAVLAIAEIDDRSGDSATALRGYLRALDLGESGATLIGRTSLLLAGAGRFVEADRLLARLPEAVLSSGGLSRFAAEVAAGAGAADRAAELARSVVSGRPDDYREQLWHGRVLSAAGHRSDAEAALRRAVSMAGNVPETRAALVEHLARAGETARAEVELAEAERALPEGKGAFALAACEEALGRLDHARARVVKVEAAQPGEVSVLRDAAAFFVRVGPAFEAEKRLRALLIVQSQPAEQAAWSRRALADLLVRDGDPVKAHEALRLIKVRDDSPDGLQVRARVLAAQKSQRHQRDAVAVLEHLNRIAPLKDADRSLLAELYEQTGDGPRAVAILKEMVTARPNDPFWLSRLANGLIRHGQVAEAASLVERLEASSPVSLSLVTLRARVLHAQGRDLEAVTRLKTLQNRPEVPLERLAAVFEELAKWEEAEEIYRTSASRPGRPEALIQLARFLGRRGRTKEALEVCEQAWKTNSPDVVARVSLEVLGASTHRGPAEELVARRIETTIATTPHSGCLSAVLGAIRMRQGRYAEAEAIYRQAVESDAKNTTYLNNLAWLSVLNGGDPTRTLAIINKAIDLAGPDPDLLDTRAMVYTAMGQTSRALDDLNEALSADASPLFYVHVAQAHLKANDRHAATEAMRMAKSKGLDPNQLHPLERAAYDRLLAAIGRL